MVPSSDPPPIASGSSFMGPISTANPLDSSDVDGHLLDTLSLAPSLGPAASKKKLKKKTVKPKANKGPHKGSAKIALPDSYDDILQELQPCAALDRWERQCQEPVVGAAKGKGKDTAQRRYCALHTEEEEVLRFDYAGQSSSSFWDRAARCGPL